MTSKTKPKTDQKLTHAAERAQFWGISVRTSYSWCAKGVPLDDPAEMVRWYAGLTAAQQNPLPRAFRVRISEERAKLVGTAGITPGQGGDVDVAEFDATYKPAADSESDDLAELKRERAFYLFRMQRARGRNDFAGEADAAKQYRMFSDLLHDFEIRSKRLGRDLGDLLPRSVLESHARCMGYHLLRCSDAAIKDIISGLSRAGCNLSAQQIQDVLRPALSTELYLLPYYRAGEWDCDAAPPDWLLTALKEGAAEVLEMETERPT